MVKLISSIYNLFPNDHETNILFPSNSSSSSSSSSQRSIHSLKSSHSILETKSRIKRITAEPFTTHNHQINTSFQNYDQGDQVIILTRKDKGTHKAIVHDNVLIVS